MLMEDRNGIPPTLLLKMVSLGKNSFWVQDIHHIMSLPSSQHLILLKTQERFGPNSLSLFSVTQII